MQKSLFQKRLKEENIKFQNKQIKPVSFLTLFSTGGGYIYPPWRISRISIGKRYQRGVKVVCKFEFSKLLPYQTDFRSKKFFGPSNGPSKSSE